MRAIIVLGGAGFIGREFCNQALNQGYKVHVLDKSESDNTLLRTLLNNRLYYYTIDLSDKSKVMDWLYRSNEFLNGDEITAVVCFAAFKDLPSSIQMAHQYYDNNLNIVLNSLTIAKLLNSKRFIFSSSAGVYSQLDGVKEGNVTAYYESGIEVLTGNVTPYGQTKRMGEFIVRDVCEQANINWYCLRYFNPIGKTKVSCDLTDSLFGTITKCINRGTELIINGGDYESPDGSCIRDYIDLRDLVSAHLFFCLDDKHISSGSYNVGTGKPTSVIEVAKAVKKLYPGFNYRIGPRRTGDDVGGYAKVTLMEYGWKCKYSLEDSIMSIMS